MRERYILQAGGMVKRQWFIGEESVPLSEVIRQKQDSVVKAGAAAQKLLEDVQRLQQARVGDVVDSQLTRDEVVRIEQEQVDASELSIPD